MTRLRSGPWPARATYRQRRSITGHTVPPSGTGRSPNADLSHNEHDLAGWGEAPLAVVPGSDRVTGTASNTGPRAKMATGPNIPLLGHHHRTLRSGESEASPIL